MYELISSANYLAPNFWVQKLICTLFTLLPVHSFFCQFIYIRLIRWHGNVSKYVVASSFGTPCLFMLLAAFPQTTQTTDNQTRPPFCTI